MITAEKLFSKTNSDGLVWALWYWNGQLSVQKLKQQFDSFINDGFNGIIIRATPNSSHGFMSDEFLEYFKLVLGWAKKEKIQIKFAGELNRKSDSDFYSCVAQKRNFRSERLVLSEKSFCPAGEKFEYTPEMLEKTYIVAIPAINKKISINDAILIYDGKNTEKTVSWIAPSTQTNWQILKFSVDFEKNRDGRFIPNMYSSELAQIYCQTSLGKILETARMVDKTTFKGFVCEMPAILPSSLGIYWDSDLISKFQAKYKKNLISLLPALFVPIDDASAKVRPQIYNFIWENIFNSFPSVVSKWAQDENIDMWLIGQEADIRNPKCGGTNTVVPNIGQTAVATAFRTENHTSQAAFIMQSETSRADGIQTVGIVGRDSTMKSYSIGELKSLIDWQILFGADKIIIDGFYLDSTYRYEDCSPLGISFTHPDYQYIKDLVAQTKRMLSVLSSRKTPKYGVAVIAPSQSRLADLQLIQESAVIIDDSVKTFLQVIGDLRTYQIPYTVISEECFAKNENIEITSDGFIKTPTGIYSAAILTYMRLINNPLFTQLEKMSLKKGIILFADKKPVGSFDDQSEAFTARIDRMFESRSRHCIIGSVSDIVDMLSKSFENVIDHIHIEKGNCGVLIDQCPIGDDLITTALNTSNENVMVEIARGANRKFLKIDVTTEEIVNIDSEITEKDAPFCIVIHPLEMIFLLETSANAKQLESFPIQKIDTIVPEYRSYINKENGIFELKSLNRFPLSRWKSMVSVNRERNTINYNYESVFESMDLPETAILVFFDKIPDYSKKIEKRFKVKLNGIELSRVNPADYPQYKDDKNLLAYDISHAIIQNKPNMISIQKNGDGDLPDPVAYPPFVLISAAVEKGPNNVWKILDSIAAKNCSWDTKGYSYLIGRASSVYRFEVPKNYQQVVLAFDDLSGASQILLNDKKYSEEEGVVNDANQKRPLSANLVFPPYRIDITDYVIDKRNDLTITSSNNMNPQNRLAPSVGGVIGNAYLEIIMKE